MRGHLGVRFAQVIPTLLLVSIMVFCLQQLMPGDPALVLAGEEDVRMPPEMVRTIYDRAAGPKEFWVIPGEGHENRGFGQAFREKILDFLARLKKA